MTHQGTHAPTHIVCIHIIFKKTQGWPSKEAQCVKPLAINPANFSSILGEQTHGRKTDFCKMFAFYPYAVAHNSLCAHTNNFNIFQ